jgi:hypothetical protein
LLTVTFRFAGTVVASSTFAEVAVALIAAFETHWTEQPCPAISVGGLVAEAVPAAIASAASAAAASEPRSVFVAVI